MFVEFATSWSIVQFSSLNVMFSLDPLFFLIKVRAPPNIVAMN